MDLFLPSPLPHAAASLYRPPSDPWPLRQVDSLPPQGALPGVLTTAAQIYNAGYQLTTAAQIYNAGYQL